MNCPECGTKMKIMDLPSETHYQASRRRKLAVCLNCGFEKEMIGGEKCR